MTVLTTLALLCLLLGTYLLSRSTYPWDGGLLVLLSLSVMLILILKETGWRKRLGGWLRRLTFEKGRRRDAIWMRGAAVAVSFGVAMAVRHQSPDSNFLGLFVIWILAILTFAISLAMSAGSRWDLPDDAPMSAWQRARSVMTVSEWWGMGLLLLAAGLLRGTALGRIPANLGGDEGTQLVAGLKLLGGDRGGWWMGNPFATGWYSVPTMSFAVYGLGMRLFGATVAGGRALSAVAGTLTVAATYGLGRAVGGRRTGWIAALTLAVSAYHIHYSRLASNQIFDPLIGTLAMGLVWRALRSRQIAGPAADALGLTAWGLAGVVAGVGWYAYFGARWVSVLIALTLGVWYLADRTLIRRHWQGFALFALGWLVVVLPLLGWYTVSPTSLSERYRAVSIFASGWLEREVMITGLPASRLMLQQLWRAATAFHLTPDPTFWYRPERPLVDFVTAALLLVGMLDAVLRLHWPARRLAHLWFWSTLVMAWVVTENPPSSQRGLLLMPVVVVFAAWGLERVGALLRLSARRYGYLVCAVLSVIAVLNVGFYFTEYVPRRVYGNPTAERAMVLSRYMLENPEPVCPSDLERACMGRVYVLGPPGFYWEFGSLAFMLRRFPGESVPPDTVLDYAVGPARFVVVPERLPEVERLRELYPGGIETALHNVDGSLMVVIYDWP